MRSWIAKLEHADTQPVWDALISVLRCDTSAFQTWGSKWDHDFCRFSLGVLVSDSSQTRQAVNNAIKRELTCPIESGASSRGKTFRDLFREKCRQGSVQLPPLDHASTSRPSSNNSSIHPSFPPLSQHPLTVSPPSLPISSCFISSKLPQFPLHTTSLSSVGSHDQNQPGKSYISSQRSLSLDGNHLSNLKGQCGRDEWGRTAWWELPSDYDVQLLPPLLLQFQLFDLRTLLLDFRWVMRTFRCLDFSRGMRQIPTEGYDFLLNHAKVSALPLPPAEIESFRLIKNAMMLIMPILWNQYSDKPKDHGFIAILATQLVGRLLDLKRRFAAIALFIDSIKTHTPRPWLLPLTRCLQEPRMDIKLAVPSNGVFTPHLIALSEDGSLLVTSGAYVEVSSEVKSDIKSETKQDSSYTETFQAKRDRRKNGSILIWDVESGKQCDCTKTSNFVRHLTIARDNGCIIAETVDGLYFWELCKDGDKWSISAPIEASQSQRLKSLSSITAAKTRLVLTTHRIPSQPTIALWNTRDGERKKIFEAVKSNANCLDVSRSGDFFASGHDNGYIHLWNISENEPVLSFSNEGNGNGQQQVEALEEVNNHALEYFRYSSSRRTVSISFLEKGEDRWLAAVSQNHVIRIWRLPPRTISKDQWKTFVSSLRTAVIRCPLVQDVQWCDNGKFFTGGDDGVARMWELSKTRTWMWFDIGKEGKRESSNLSTVLVSCGKHSRFVATYVTKSPYVTVWDMSNSGSDAEPWREPLYRSYFPMVRNSVDARDMGHLSTHQHMNDEMMKCVMDSNTDASQKTLDTGELQLFQNHDNPNCTSIEGDMQPWLRMKLETWKDELRVCFEQPVRSGASGKFLGLKLEPRKGEPTQYLMGNSTVNNTDVAQHHGMVATLQDMTTGIFQVQDVEGEGGKKDDQDVSDVRSGSTVIREKDNMGEGDDMYALSAGVEAKI